MLIILDAALRAFLACRMDSKGEEMLRCGGDGVPSHDWVRRLYIDIDIETGIGMLPIPGRRYEEVGVGGRTGEGGRGIGIGVEGPSWSLL